MTPPLSISTTAGRLTRALISFSKKSPTLELTLHRLILPHLLLPSGLFPYASHHPNSSYSLIKSLSSLLLCDKTLEAADLTNRFPANGQIAPRLDNALLSALSSDGFLESARKLFDKMLEREIMFNDLGFSCFVKRFCGLEGLDKILSLVDDVKERGCKISRSVVAVLIVGGFCRVGKIEEVWRSLEELRRIGWKPDFIVYRIVSGRTSIGE